MSVGAITGTQYDNNTGTGTPLLKIRLIQLNSIGSNQPTSGSEIVGLAILGAIIIFRYW